jgi:GTP cyclohydrolase I
VSDRALRRGADLHVVSRGATEPTWAGDPSAPRPPSSVEDAYRRLLQVAEPETWKREGLADTPARAARAWADLTFGYHQDPADLFTTFEADGYDQMVVVRDVAFYSLCEHHLLPFHGEMHVGYVPGDRIVGISKIARLVELFARRLQVQERLTTQIADTLEEYLQPKGVIVVAGAEHLCMTMRGVQKPGARTITSAVRGMLEAQPEARAEALALLQRRS